MEDLAYCLNNNSFMGLEEEAQEFHRMYGFWEGIDISHAMLENRKCHVKWFCSRTGGEYSLTLLRDGRVSKSFRYPDRFSVNEKILYGYVEGEGKGI